MMGITKAILNWTEDKFYSLDMDDKHAELKAFGLGAINGAIDAAVVCYPLVLASCYYWKKKALKK